MASLYEEHNRTILRISNLPNRPKIRLGKINLRQAKTIKAMVEALVGAYVSGLPISEDLGHWLDTIDGKLKDQLAKIGLIEKPKTGRLGNLAAFYVERKAASCKPGTVTRLRQAEQDAVAFFGHDRKLHAITEADCEDFRHHLMHTREPKTLGEATARKRCGDIRAMLKYAVKAGVLKSNPMEAVPTANIGTTLQRFIPEADAIKVMDQLPNSEWRLLFALARWGGMRVVSEPLRLTWADIDFAEKRITIHSPKTERYQGKAFRTLPMFPELAGPLQDVFDQAAEGEPRVLPFLHDRTSAALRKPMEKAIEAAGVQPWPRLWHNLRATRQTELEDRFPTHVVCGWVGNSPDIAKRHYLQTTTDHFDAATGLEKQGQSSEKTGAKTGAVGDGNGQDWPRPYPADDTKNAENLVLEGFPRVQSDPYGI